MENPMLNSTINNICPPQWKDDFRSHFLLQLMEMKETKLQQAWNNGWIEWLCVKILSNQMNSNTSSFWKIYRNGGFNGDRKVILQSDYEGIRNDYKEQESSNPISYEGAFGHDTSDDDIERLELIELKRDRIIEALNGRHYYHRHLFILHINGMTYRQIEKETEISYQSIRLSILSTIEWLKNNLKNDINKFRNN